MLTIIPATMATGAGKTLHYRRSHFVTQLPVDYRYTPSHAWLAQRAGNLWRVGLTRFATRMLGDMVDHGFETAPGTTVQIGQIVGWVEGFKAISDIFCVVQGEFVGVNPLLREKMALVNKDGYAAGWLYEVNGTPDAKCLNVNQYRDLLDKTIDRLLAQRKGEEIK